MSLWSSLKIYISKDERTKQIIENKKRTLKTNIKKMCVKVKPVVPMNKHSNILNNNTKIMVYIHIINKAFFR